MLPITILFLIGCLLGLILFILPIIFRKYLQQWVLVFMAFLGILIFIGCGIMFLCLGFFSY